MNMLTRTGQRCSPRPSFPYRVGTGLDLEVPFNCDDLGHLSIFFPKPRVGFDSVSWEGRRGRKPPPHHTPHPHRLILSNHKNRQWPAPLAATLCFLPLETEPYKKQLELPSPPSYYSVLSFQANDCLQPLWKSCSFSMGGITLPISCWNSLYSCIKVRLGLDCPRPNILI